MTYRYSPIATYVFSPICWGCVAAVRNQEPMDNHQHEYIEGELVMDFGAGAAPTVLGDDKGYDKPGRA